MKKQILAVLEPKEEYANLFLNYVKELRDSLFDTRVFTKIEALKMFMQENRVDVLLASEQSEYEEVRKEAGFTILLTEGRMVRENDLYPSVYKFQSAEQILREVFDLCVEECEDKNTYYLPKQIRCCRQLAVFSPYGGTGKTTLSVVLGHLLGAKKKVLVVNLEPFSRPSDLIPNGDEDGLSRLIYYMKLKRSDLDMKLQSLIRRIGNTDYLSGVRHYLDIQGMRKKDLEQLFHALWKYTSYDVIVYDVSFLNEGIEGLLEQCDVLYEPVIGEGCGKSWIKRFSRDKQKILEEKWQQVLLPKEDRLPQNIELLARGSIGISVGELLGREASYEQLTKRDSQTSGGKNGFNY